MTVKMNTTRKQQEIYARRCAGTECKSVWVYECLLTIETSRSSVDSASVASPSWREWTWPALPPTGCRDVPACNCRVPSAWSWAGNCTQGNTTWVVSVDWHKRKTARRRQIDWGGVEVARSFLNVVWKTLMFVLPGSRTEVAQHLASRW